MSITSSAKIAFAALPRAARSARYGEIIGGYENNLVQRIQYEYVPD
jgi:hypothetical protein